MPQRQHDGSAGGRSRAVGVVLLAAALAFTGVAGPAASVDLTAARRETLANGLTLLVLEDHAFPVASVQMLYRVGARHEETGRTGLAHFLEHMAFRASENFPDTGLVSSIYAVGGEWHGYTWIDQTTYYATAPREELDLLLEIEVDRMSRLLIPAAEVEAERGAVLAEMHGYQNDPASVLKDSVVAVSFLQHSYRHNTIGWQSDVEAIGHADLVDFYRRWYRPENAVLAVVGSVSVEQVIGRVRELFAAPPETGRTKGRSSEAVPSARGPSVVGPLQEGPSDRGPRPAGRFRGNVPTVLPGPPPTVEPEQRGVRRIELRGAGARGRFEIVYRAPAASSPDFPAFLLLQELLGGGEGVNFLQNEWGVAVRADRRLAAVEGDLVTWLPPTAAPYVFSIAGWVDPAADPAAVEAAVEEAVAMLRTAPVPPTELEAARRAVLRELVFDLETTEDAAHQLAYFEGIGALDALLELPGRLAAVTPADLQRVAAACLTPEKQTIGWYLAGSDAAVASTAPQAESSAAAGSEAFRPECGIGTGSAAPAGASRLPRSPEFQVKGAPARRRLVDLGGSASAWSPSGDSRAADPGEAGASVENSRGREANASAPTSGRPPAVLTRLASGLPVIFQRVSFSPSAHLRVLLPSTAVELEGDAVPDEPVWRSTSLNYPLLPAELDEVLARARNAIDAVRPSSPPGNPPGDPAARLEAFFDEVTGTPAPPFAPRPAALVLVGDLEPGPALAAVARTWGDVVPAHLATGDASSVAPLASPPQPADKGGRPGADREPRTVASGITKRQATELAAASLDPAPTEAPVSVAARLESARFDTAELEAPATEARPTGLPVVAVTVPAGPAQARIGYVVAAPPWQHADAWAWRCLLYVLSHDYEGRLGKEAISRRGLIYYVDARYHSNGARGRVSLAIGVDPGKLEAMVGLLRETLQGLRREPPTEAEVAEARQHFLGRLRSAAQSPREISAALLERWLGRGRLPSEEEIAREIVAVERQHVLRVVPAFLDGTLAVVRIAGSEPGSAAAPPRGSQSARRPGRPAKLPTGPNGGRAGPER